MRSVDNPNKKTTHTTNYKTSRGLQNGLQGPPEQGYAQGFTQGSTNGSTNGATNGSIHGSIHGSTQWVYTRVYTKGLHKGLQKQGPPEQGLRLACFGVYKVQHEALSFKLCPLCMRPAGALRANTLLAEGPSRPSVARSAP